MVRWKALDKFYNIAYYWLKIFIFERVVTVSPFCGVADYKSNKNYKTGEGRSNSREYIVSTKATQSQK